MNNLQIRVERGFTLIELMVVITIIGLLASTVLASLSNSRIAARDVSRVQAVKELQKSLELYRNANSGNYPCATAMPACTNGGAEISVNGSSRNAFFDVAVGNYYKPNNETINVVAGWLTSGSIQYRTGGTTGAPVTSSYTILLRREQAAKLPNGAVLAAGASCGVRVGPNPNTVDWPVGTYPDCF